MDTNLLRKYTAILIVEANGTVITGDITNIISCETGVVVELTNSTRQHVHYGRSSYSFNPAGAQTHYSLSGCSVLTQDGHLLTFYVNPENPNDEQTAVFSL